jgi:3-methyladenine DNA glycosylase AlkD
VKILGVRTPLVRIISRDYFRQIEGNGKKEIFSLCEELFKTGYNEHKTIAIDWASRIKKDYEKKDFIILENWLKKYITNWGSCDDFCTHAFGEFLLLFPEFIFYVKCWAESKHRWLKRASAVIFILPLRRKKFMKDAFCVADILLEDEDDLVQKGYGWMLKEASNVYQKEVFDYVMKNKRKMPRTALRYAVEKMPQKLRKKTMGK